MWFLLPACKNYMFMELYAFHYRLLLHHIYHIKITTGMKNIFFAFCDAGYFTVANAQVKFSGKAGFWVCSICFGSDK